MLLRALDLRTSALAAPDLLKPSVQLRHFTLSVAAAHNRVHSFDSDTLALPSFASASMASRLKMLQQLQQRAVGSPLRAVAVPLTLTALHAAPARLLSRQLLAVMEQEESVGVAAPQLGHSLRMFAAQLDEAYEHDEDDARSSAQRRQLKPRLVISPPQPSVLVNPRLLWSSPRQSLEVEGCLSLPGLSGLVRRPSSIRVSYLDGLTGEPVEDVPLEGFRARIFLHELDHLVSTQHHRGASTMLAKMS